MPRLLDLPLQWRIGALVVAGLLAIFGLFTLLGATVVRDSTQRIVSERLVIAQMTASFIDDEFGEQFSHLEQVAALTRNSGDGVAERQQLLHNYLTQQESFVRGVFLTDPSGRVVWSEPQSVSDVQALLQANPDARPTISPGARTVSGVHASGATGTPEVVLEVAAQGADGKVAGALAEVIDPSQTALEELVVAARKLGQTGHAELVDQYGRVILSSEPNRILGPAEHPGFYLPLLESHTSAVGTTPPIGNEDPAEQGQRHVMAFVPLDNVPWGLSLGGSEAELWAEAGYWQQETSVFGGLSLVVALLLVWATTRSVARPVRALTSASRRIAAGDLETPVSRQGQGEVRELAVAFDDMRKHLQDARTALAVAKSRYQGIVGSMADAVFTTDLESEITAMNPAAESLTGWHASELLGRRFDDVFHPLEAASLPSDGQPPIGVTDGVTKERIRCRDGREVVVATARSAIRDDGGALAGMVHVLRDVSAEEELSRLKDEFLSTVSHELRTPLGFVKGYATTLLLPDGLADVQTTQRCLQVIVEASDELEELVGNLLDMSKIGAGVLAVDPQPVELHSLARAAVERVRVRAGEDRVRIAVPSTLPQALADAHRIEQVLYNLLDNAVKYSPEGGQVVVEAKLSGDFAVVSVSDEGLGIPEEERATLFERFHRGASARKRRIGGSGLGLAICKGIVEAHGGRIWVESPAPGRSRDSANPGSVVSFTLPVASDLARSGRGRQVAGSSGGNR